VVVVVLKEGLRGRGREGRGGEGRWVVNRVENESLVRGFLVLCVGCEMVAWVVNHTVS
jgi:hypothetical protein